MIPGYVTADYAVKAGDFSPEGACPRLVSMPVRTVAYPQSAPPP